MINYESNGKNVKAWVKDITSIEDGTIDQISNLAKLPFTFRHIAVMPDTHLGYGMPIGSVLCTKDVVIPNAVGVDIGCGMCFVKTNLKVGNQRIFNKILKEILSKIRNTIPTGQSSHQHPRQMDDYYRFDFDRNIETPIINSHNKKRNQLGTLGGGNHFIEIQKDEDDYVCIMIHSGSRNIGYQVANYYNKEAKKLNSQWFSSVKKEWDLAFLPIKSTLGEQYLEEMRYCIRYAKENRKLMLSNVKQIFNQTFEDVIFDKTIDCIHNFARMENHFGENVMVHRKGATRAGLDEMGIVPGSQGSNSYIVKGLGNKDSYYSCSHGAGRKYSRKKAKKELNLIEEQKKLSNIGVLHNMNSSQSLDEAPGAYKDIEEVMLQQKDLINIVSKLTPIGVIKG